MGIAAALLFPMEAGADALPDGRVYEQVSPTVKNGFDAGAPNGDTRYSVATADGSALLYGTRGPMGDANRGVQDFAIGRRGVDGWSSASAIPAGSADRISAFSHSPSEFVVSSDMTNLIFAATGSFVPDNPLSLDRSAALYKGYADGTVEWITRPQIPNSLPAPGNIGNVSYFQPVGASPDLSTLYVWAGPPLLPADAARTPLYDPESSLGPWGLYEYSGGVLKPAGTLPNGTESPGGAAPASSASDNRNFISTTPDTTGNQVSRDGKTLFFVSPDPALGQVTQVYVRRDGHSKLVSHTQSSLTAPAPSGASAIRGQQYAYASPDGTKVMFRSVDVLAPGAPNDSSPKAYRYDVATGTVSYLPGVDGFVAATSDDGERFLFGRFDAVDSRITVWDHGTIKNIMSGFDFDPRIMPARATASGSTFVFTTPASINGANTGGFAQIYRYDVEQERTTCLSCPPDGITPTADVRFATSDGGLVARRGMSTDVNRVFFDSPDPLVVRDSNGRRDVYEWTPSGRSLLSSGRSKDDSFVLDNSASGDDVFITTAEGLVSGDTDGSFDVYDVRVGGGFKQADEAAPCAGDACQGAASGAPTLQAPGSAGFSGPGNQEPLDTSKAAPTTKLKLGSRKVVGSTLQVKVTIARPGRVTVSGGGLRRATKSYTKAGTFTVAVPLTATARRSLKSKRRLKLSARVGFTPSSGAASSVKFVLNAKA